jgi:hypothetical protein
MKNNPSVNVVILNFNTINVLKECLPQVIGVCQIPNVTITLVDNASTDGSADWVSAEYPEISLIKLAKNNGYAGGYNESLQQLTDDYFLLLNSDATLSKNWLEPLLECAKKYPKFGAAQPHILDYYNRNKFEYAGAAGGFIDAYSYPFCRGRIFGNVENNNQQYQEEIPIFWASGAAFFIKREAWQKANGLDEAFFAHMEEIDLCWRLQLLGYSIFSVPNSIAYHIGGATLANQSPRKTFLNFRNNLLLMHKNLHPDVRESLILKRKLLDGLAAVFFALKFQFNLIPQIIKAHREFEKIKSQFIQSANPKCLNELTGTVNESIVFGYFIRGKKTWDSWFNRI